MRATHAKRLCNTWTRAFAVPKEIFPPTLSLSWFLQSHSSNRFRSVTTVPMMLDGMPRIWNRCCSGRGEGGERDFDSCLLRVWLVNRPFTYFFAELQMWFGLQMYFEPSIANRNRKSNRKYSSLETHCAQHADDGSFGRCDWCSCRPPSRRRSPPPHCCCCCRHGRHR